MTISELKASKWINPQLVIPIGPAEKIKKALHSENITIVEQGNDIAENFIRGIKYLFDKKQPYIYGSNTRVQYLITSPSGKRERVFIPLSLFRKSLSSGKVNASLSQ